MAMTGLAGAQTLLPDISPRGNTTPASSPSGGAPSSPVGTPSGQGSAPPAAVSAGSLQAQLEAQQKDIDRLAGTVGMLTQQLQQTRLATAREDGSVAPQAGAMQPGLGQSPGTMIVAQAAEELRKNQQMLAELEKERAAAAQAPADEQLKKQLELQRKQLELLNKMVKLLASELEKQGPIVGKLQTQVATLEARSKQAAQRDQELANGLDDLTESVDASRRYGPQLPAPLKELFLPSGTNETPFTIYNALSMRYNDFTSQKGMGQFQFIEYDPILLLRLNNQFLFEGQLEVHTDGIEPEYAQIERHGHFPRIEAAGDQPGQHETQAGKQDHRFKRHRDERGQGVPRPAPHVQRPIPGARPELKRQSQGGAAQTTSKTDARQPGPFQAHCPVQAVDSTGNVGIVDPPAVLPGGLRCPEQVLVSFETAHDEPAHACSFAASRPGSNMPLTSAMAMTGRNRQKIRKQVKNRPKLPASVATSIDVGT
jgi:hypothetical protein